jgi:hypothetical protein
MTRHSVRLALAALAMLGLSASAASAGCYGCGYTPPCCGVAVVPSYEPPVRTIIYPRPMYIVNQGPAFNAPVVGTVDRMLDEGQYVRRVVRWHRHRHHHWHHHQFSQGCAMGCGFH